MKKIIPALILIVTLGAAAAFAQDGPAPADLPKIAVYVTGGVPGNEAKALGTRMLAALVNSGRYRGIERSRQFLAEIDKEHLKQRSGAIDDSQISELGKQFGVKFVCIADITPIFNSYQVSARIVDVETAEVVLIGESSSPLRTIDDFTQVSNAVADLMFGGQSKPAEGKPTPSARPAPRPKTLFSAGAGAFFAGDIGGGMVWSGEDGGLVKMPYLSVGAYLFVDAAYAEASAAYHVGGGKWESPNRSDGLFYMNRASVSFGLFAKYPVSLGKVKVFPLIGAEYDASIFGTMVRDDGSKYPFDGKYGSPGEPGDLSALWVKLGGGIDVGLGKTAYLRAELLYGARTANTFEESESGSGAQARPGHGLTLKAGAGVRF